MTSATDGDQEPDDRNAHAEANAVHLRQLERETSMALIRTHNAIVAGVDEIEDVDEDDLSIVEPAQRAELESAIEQLDAVASEIADDDLIHDERLLAESSRGVSRRA